MKHDLQHEERQNEALRHLAKAIESVAAHIGMSGVKKLAEHVENILKADDSEPAEKDAEGAPKGEEPSAES